MCIVRERLDFIESPLSSHPGLDNIGLWFDDLNIIPETLQSEVVNTGGWVFENFADLIDDELLDDDWWDDSDDDTEYI